MTSFRRSRTAAALVGALAAALLLALSGCTSSGPPPRTTPNAVERAAVQAAVGFSGIGNPNADIAWVQLWTIRQYPQAIASCAVAASHGALQVEVGPLSGGNVQISYRNTGSDVHPTEAEVGDIIRQCQYSTPVDQRVLKLAPSQRDALYSYDLTVLRGCLLSHGYSVGPVPTRDTFDLLLGAQQPWSPYDQVRVPSRTQWYAISDACPALPASLEPSGS
jgi:hypothetical protein